MTHQFSDGEAAPVRRWRATLRGRLWPAVVLAAVMGCGGSGPKIIVPENPKPLPTESDRLTHSDEGQTSPSESQAPPQQ